MIDKTRVTDSGARVLRVLKALRGQTLVGLSNGELAKSLGDSPATINRCMNTLIAEGMAIKLDSGRFALSISVLQIAQAHADEMSRATNRINEINQRVMSATN